MIGKLKLTLFCKAGYDSQKPNKNHGDLMALSQKTVMYNFDG